jgi:hypothetical protein
MPKAAKKNSTPPTNTSGNTQQKINPRRDRRNRCGRRQHCHAGIADRDGKCTRPNLGPIDAYMEAPRDARDRV